MSSHHFPILIWNIPGAGTGAALAGDLEPAAASGATESDAVRQLKDLLEWRHEHAPRNAPSWPCCSRWPTRCCWIPDATGARELRRYRHWRTGANRLIACKELADLAAREGLAAAGLQLRWTERLVTAVAAAGYDHRLGARPLQRALERLVVAPLARWKVAHPRERNRTLQLDCTDGLVSVTLTQGGAGA